MKEKFITYSFQEEGACLMPQGHRVNTGSVRGMEAWPRAFIVVSTERTWQGRVDKFEQAEFWMV